MGIALWASVFLREVLSQTRLVLLFAGVVAAVSTGGLGPGLLAIAMAAVGARLMLIDPDMGSATGDTISLVAFGVVCLLMAWATEWPRARRRQAEELAARWEEQSRLLQEQSIELETQIEESQALQEELEQSSEEVLAANDRLEQHRERQDFLLRASTTLASSLDYPATLRTVAQLSVETLADWCSVAMARPDGTYETVALAHRDPARVRWAEEYNRQYPPRFDAPHGVPAVLRTGRSEFHRQLSPDLLRASAQTPEQLRVLEELGLRSVIIAPMVARGRNLGTISFITADSGRLFDDDDLRIAEDLAARAGLAIDNALLFAAEGDSRVHAERLALRSQLLAAASTLLTESLDLDGALDRLAGLITSQVGEYAQIYLIEGDQLRRVASSCVIDDRRPVLRLLEQRPPLRLDGNTPPGRVARTGEPLLLAEVDPAHLARIADDEEHATLLQSLGMRSMVVAPLTTRDRTIGVLLFSRLTDGPLFTAEDLALGVELARRGAVAVDNALLYGEAQRSRREAEQANQAKRDFLAAMSHELRTPLNAIAGYAELIALGIHGPVTPAQTDALDRLRRSQRHLQTLVEEVLNFARVEAGRLTLVLEDVAIGPTLARVVEMVTPQMAERHLLFEQRTVDPDLTVRADADRLEQVMLNLLANAVKFSREGGRIALEVVAQGPLVAITVVDSGPGIPSDKLETVFEPFVQLTATPSQRAAGVGLGLAISRDLARAMHGEISVESPPGGGSRFTVRLPRGGGLASAESETLIIPPPGTDGARSSV